jgi:hypothetical protein
MKNGYENEATWDDEKTEKVKTHEDDEFSDKNGGKMEQKWSILSEK